MARRYRGSMRSDRAFSPSTPTLVTVTKPSAPILASITYRLPLANRPPDGVAEIVGAVDAHGLDAARPGERSKIRVVGPPGRFRELCNLENMGSHEE